MKKLISGVFALTVLMFGACTKAKDGAPGAQGPQGVQGNANVVSGTVTVSNWTYDGTNKLYTTTIIDNDITQDIVDKGMVMVYVYSTGNLALPLTMYLNSSVSETMYHVYGLQQVIIRVQDSNLMQPANPGTVTFRVVKVASKMASNLNNVDFKNYESVKKALNLKD